jgi:hypothetical protein
MAAIVSSVVAALVVAAIFGALRSRWLFVVAPKLYLNTPFSSGQMVSLTIINAGLASEEDVAVTLRSACKFQLAATSKSTLVVNGMTLSLPRLARGEAVTVLLLVEGRAFDPTDIESVESKATKGKVVESREKVSAAWHHFIVWPIFLLGLGVPFVFGTVMGSEMRMSAFQYIDSKLELLGSSKQLAGFSNVTSEKYSSGSLASAFKSGRLSLLVEEIVRRGDVLTMRVKVSNATGDVLLMEGSVESSAGGRGPVDYTDSRIEKVALANGESKVVQLKVFLPESLSVKLLQGSYRFDAPSGGDLTVSQIIAF